VQLGTAVVREALRRAKLEPAKLTAVITGNVVQAAR